MKTLKTVTHQDFHLPSCMKTIKALIHQGIGFSGFPVWRHSNHRTVKRLNWFLYSTNILLDQAGVDFCTDNIIVLVSPIQMLNDDLKMKQNLHWEYTVQTIQHPPQNEALYLVSLALHAGRCITGWLGIKSYYPSITSWLGIKSKLCTYYTRAKFTK